MREYNRQWGDGCSSRHRPEVGATEERRDGEPRQAAPFRAIVMFLLAYYAVRRRDGAWRSRSTRAGERGNVAGADAETRGVVRMSEGVASHDGVNAFVGW